MSFIPATLDITIYQGDDFSFSFRVRTKNPDGTTGAYVDLTGYTPAAQIRATEAATSSLADFTATIDDQVATPGQVTLSLTNVQTTALPTTGGVWDVQLTDGAGKIQTYIKGAVTVIAQVTR
jgi:hypothetical protein